MERNALGREDERQAPDDAGQDEKIGGKAVQQRIDDAVEHDEHPQTTDGHENQPGKSRTVAPAPTP